LSHAWIACYDFRFPTTYHQRDKSVALARVNAKAARMSEGPGAAPGETVAQSPVPDDKTLARNARTDRDAFAQLYRRHADRVYRYLLVRLADQHLAQDVTAQTFLVALERLATYRGDGEFVSWLLAIARNKAADALRSRAATLPLEAAADVAAPQPAPDQVVDARLRLDEVARALRAIAPERAEALALRVVGGLSAAEAAVVMGKSEAAVKMLVSRAIHDLRERLAFSGEAET
jgi:RNA polymerase sigma-70 factor (ECF subfamily)